MAVQNYLTNYAPLEDPNGIPVEWAIRGHGVKKAYFQNTAAILNGDSIGSTYTVLKNVSADAIIGDLAIETDAITSCTACQIGIYDSVTGVAYSTNCYATALDLHTAIGKNGPPADGLNQLTHEQTMQTLWELAGHTLLTKRGTYDIVLALTQAATASGSVTFRGTILPPG